MSTRWCDRADEYYDGELDAPTAPAFREHLPGCKDCSQRVLGAMMLDVAAESSGAAGAGAGAGAEGAPVTSLSWFRRHRALLAIATTASAVTAAAAWLLWLKPPS